MMKKILFISTLLLSVTILFSCKKVCSACPSGETLVVDEPKEGNCICCPEGMTYIDGYCQN